MANHSPLSNAFFIALLGLTAVGCGQSGTGPSAAATSPGNAAPSSPPTSPRPTATPAPCNKDQTRTQAVRELITPAQSEFPMVLRMDIAAGWKGCGVFTKEAEGGLMMVGTWKVGYVYPDPCHWKPTLATAPAAGSADDIAQSFADQTGTDAGPIEPATLGGRFALHVTLNVEGDLDGSSCDVEVDDPQFRFMQGDGDSVWWLGAIEAAQLIADVWVLDFDGVPYLIQAVHWPDNSAAQASEETQMVESIEFQL